MNTPEHPREHPCSKWREHPLNTPPANTGRMKPKARKPNKIKGFACLNTLHTFSVNFTAWLEHIVHIMGRGAEAPPVADEAGFETPGKRAIVLVFSEERAAALGRGTQIITPLQATRSHLP